MSETGELKNIISINCHTSFGVKKRRFALYITGGNNPPSFDIGKQLAKVRKSYLQRTENYRGLMAKAHGFKAATILAEAWPSPYGFSARAIRSYSSTLSSNRLTFLTIAW